MRIAIGTKSPPKVEAIKEAIKKCIYFEGMDVEVISEKVDSGISDMPISMEENMQGAKNRAENISKIVDSDLYVGMEGGTTKIGDKVYLFGVVYILNNNGNGHFGISNMMEVPEIFHKRIYDNGEELGPILKEISGEEGASQKNGAFGHWSDNMYTRKDQFIIAFISGIVPFYNKYYK